MFLSSIATIYYVHKYVKPIESHQPVDNEMDDLNEDNGSGIAVNGVLSINETDDGIASSFGARLDTLVCCLRYKQTNETDEVDGIENTYSLIRSRVHMENHAEQAHSNDHEKICCGLDVSALR